MVQAVAAAWTFSGCRSNEICRLGLDCTYFEDVPEQTDPVTGEVLPAFRQAMLRVPANKTRGEFVKPMAVSMNIGPLVLTNFGPPSGVEPP